MFHFTIYTSIMNIYIYSIFYQPYHLTPIIKEKNKYAYMIWIIHLYCVQLDTSHTKKSNDTNTWKNFYPEVTEWLLSKLIVSIFPWLLTLKTFLNKIFVILSVIFQTNFLFVYYPFSFLIHLPFVKFKLSIFFFLYKTILSISWSFPNNLLYSFWYSFFSSLNWVSSSNLSFSKDNNLLTSSFWFPWFFVINVQMVLLFVANGE
jgi:hypothetical protein